MADDYAGPAFKLFLHPLHGTRGRGLKPLVIEELSAAPSDTERVQLLSVTAASAADMLPPHASELVEVQWDHHALYVADGNKLSLLLPLALSQIVEFEEMRWHVSEMVGVMAYGYPSTLHLQSWGTTNRMQRGITEECMGHVWVLLASQRNEIGRIATNNLNVLQMATEELGAHGAIRCDFGGFEFVVSSTLGEGASASVQLMRNRAAVPDGFGPQDTRRYAPPGSTHSSSISVAAAKVYGSQVAAHNVYDEARYLIAAQSHPNIIRFAGVICDCRLDVTSRWTLLLEAHIRGDVRNMLDQQGPFTEIQSLMMTQGVLSALVHIHKLEVVHRDVKAENVLLHSTDARPVLTDFGIAAHMSETEKIETRCGSPGCIAPEILRQTRCVLKSDVFSTGVFLYLVLSSRMPFMGATRITTLVANAKAKPKFGSAFNDKDDLVKECVAFLLRKDTERRPCARMAYHAVTCVLRKLGESDEGDSRGRDDQHDEDDKTVSEEKDARVDCLRDDPLPLMGEPFSDLGSDNGELSLGDVVSINSPLSSYNSPAGSVEASLDPQELPEALSDMSVPDAAKHRDLAEVRNMLQAKQGLGAVCVQGVKSLFKRRTSQGDEKEHASASEHQKTKQSLHKRLIAMFRKAASKRQGSKTNDLISPLTSRASTFLCDEEEAAEWNAEIIA